MAGNHIHKALLDRNILSYRYCIPMDEYHRAITVAEEGFFSECDTDNGTL
jgi:hypothetical protein